MENASSIKDAGRGPHRALRCALSTLLGCSLLPLLLFACKGQDEPTPTRGPFPPQTIGGSEIRILPRSGNGRMYQLHVGLPESYEEDPGRRYPALFLCDGYWDFGLVRAIAGNLYGDKAIPEVIVIGIGYPGERPHYAALRRWDLTPVAATYEGARYDGPSGHAQEFLSVLEHEIIPFVEREYRADPSYRVLAGSSLGGLFTLYAMFARPGLFVGHIAASPAAQWADDWLLGFEQEFHHSGKPLGSRLFLSYADQEPSLLFEGVKRLDARLRERRYPGLAYELYVVRGEGHASTKAEGFNRGVRFAFSPRAPQTP